MNMTRHGLSIGIERVGNEFFLSLKAIGTLTHKDYEKIKPMIDSALASINDPKVKVGEFGEMLEENESWLPDGWVKIDGYSPFDCEVPPRVHCDKCMVEENK